MVNPKIAEALGMAPPPEPEKTTHLVTVLPNEISMMNVENSELPNMDDANQKQLEAEKQLEKVIELSMNQAETLQGEVSTIEPKYRSRTVEVANDSMKIALEAIKLKIDTQFKTKETRLEELNYQRKSKSAGGENKANSITNFYVGSREELMKLMDDTNQSK